MSIFIWGNFCDVRPHLNLCLPMVTDMRSFADHRKRNEPVEGRRGGVLRVGGAGQAGQRLSQHQHRLHGQEGSARQVRVIWLGAVVERSTREQKLESRGIESRPRRSCGSLSLFLSDIRTFTSCFVLGVDKRERGNFKILSAICGAKKRI